MKILSFSVIAENIKKEINHICGLNMSQTRILLYFYHSKNAALKMGDLAVNLKISLSTLSRQLQQDKTRQLVKIIRSETDSSKTVLLSDEGLKKAAELKGALNSIEEKMEKGFTRQEISNFNYVLDQLKQRIKD